MKTYAIELRHDGSKFFIKVQASSMKQAKKIVMEMEECPESAIVRAALVKETSRKGD